MQMFHGRQRVDGSVDTVVISVLLCDAGGWRD
jgi:hypothetical protein